MAKNEVSLIIRAKDLASRVFTKFQRSMRAVGSVVKVEGTLVNGVVIADKIQLQQSIEIEDQTYEVHGRVEQLDTTARSFVVKGYTFDYDAATVFKLGETAFANQIQVEVKAVPRGGRLYALEVKRDD